MDSPISYRRAFLRSPHHGWLGALTLGVGFAVANGIGLIAGAAAYALGWIYLPDLPFFKKWVDSRNAGARVALDEAELATFRRKQAQMLAKLGPEQARRYASLSAVCAEIERSGASDLQTDTPSLHSPQLRRLDDLMWTYLKMLTIEQSLVEFLQGEHSEDLPGLLQETERSLENLKLELKEAMSESVRESRKRLEQSQTDRLIVLQKRIEKSDQAAANLELVRSEQNRLEDQIKLVRADAVASRNTSNLSTRINATVEQLDHTNRWMSEMEEFKDLVGELPASNARVGYQPQADPVQDTEMKPRRTPPPLASGGRR